MPQSQPTAVAQNRRTNRILAALPSGEREMLRPHLEALPLPVRMSLYDTDRPIPYVYFIHRGVASMTTSMNEGLLVEIATAGPEGVVGMPVFLGADQVAHQAFMQIPGEGARIAAETFRRVLQRCPMLHRLLLRYTLALLSQIGQNAACNRAHSVEERCARWLLMTQDRVGEPSFPLTQEFLAQMLGVRRPTVSIAAGMLARAGVITYMRGQITILDRAGLEAAACECYRVITDEFDRLFDTETLSAAGK
jgi:CRP-like cAMP-binding protein